MTNFTNLSALEHIEPINLSFGNLTTLTGATQTLQDTATTSVGDFWFIGAILVLFGMMSWWFYRPDKTFALDMTRSLMISSSWCIFISLAFLLSGWVSTVFPVIWFSTIWVIAVVSIRKLKSKGL